MTDTALTQLSEIRNSNEANMIDRDAVQRAADERDYHELVVFIQDATIDEYSDLLMRL